jgi:predicted metal-dependent hydrolase
MFIHAGSLVLDEIVFFLKNKKTKMPHFHKFIRENRERLPAKPLKKITVKTSGKYYDLRKLYDEVNAEYFGGQVSTDITWGSKSPRYSVRKRTVGSYSLRSNMIRINPVLDRKTVPRFYVSFVVYHEMLHAVLGVSRKGERRSVHPREFRTREKFFKDYERARAWELGSGRS